MSTSFGSSVLDAAIVDVSAILTAFASQDDFYSAIALAFGDAYDVTGLEGIRQQWLSGDFSALPQVEILSGSQLQGANAAYAGATNTIYFSADFLSQYANNAEAVKSVFLEEIGHSVDWKINTIDTPGDEGELFSAIAQDIELSESQVQTLKQENDSVLLNLNSALFDAEKSDDYQFNFKNVFEGLVQDGGYSMVSFINGVFTTPDEYRTQAAQLSDKLNLIQNEKIEINGEIFSGSIKYQFAGENDQYDKYYNKSDKTGNFVVDIGLPIIRGVGTGLLVCGLSAVGGKTSTEEIIEKSASVKWSNIGDALKFLQEVAGFDAAGLIENGLKGLLQGLSDLAILEQPKIKKQQAFNDAQAVFNEAKNAFNNASDALANAADALKNFIEGSIDVLQGEYNEAQKNFNETKQDLQVATNKFNDAKQDLRDATNNFITLFGNMTEQYGDAWEEYFEKYKNDGLFKEVLKTFAPVIDGFINGKNPIEDADFAKAIIDTVIAGVTMLPIPWLKVANAIYEGTIAALPKDIEEAFSQFWFSGTPNESKELIEQWKNAIVTELKDTNNSFMPIGYSQGNFFFEDALKDMRDAVSDENTRVFALGSPTKYLPVGGLQTFNGDDDYNIKNDNDPITKLQFDNDFFIDKFKVLFDAAVTAFKAGGLSGHDFGSYVDNARLKKGFNKSFQELHPQGYYFPSDPIQATGFAEGTKDDDWLEGSDGNDALSGLARNDVLRGNGGDDTLIGGQGYDLMDGGTGVDTAYYLSSFDRIIVQSTKYAGSDVYKIQDGFGFIDTVGNVEQIIGSRFRDAMYGGNYTDTFYGGEGIDTLVGGGGDDKLYGQADTDYLYGQDGNDLLDGGNEDNAVDYLYGDAGNDTIRGWGGNDHIEGGIGIDTVEGGSGNDYIEGNSEGDFLYGESGVDTIFGGSGNDYIEGNGEGDFLYGESGNDYFIGGTGNDFIDGGDQIDLVDYQNSTSGVIVNIEEGQGFNHRRQARYDWLVNDSNPDFYHTDLEPDFAISAGTAFDGLGYVDTLRNLENIIGTNFNDILIGNEFNNAIWALAGNDLVIGNAGNDYLDGGSGINTLSYRRDAGGVTVNLANGTATDGWGGQDAITNFIHLVGSEYNDNLTGDAQNNIITGGDGNDRIDGGLGNDNLYGELGDDTIIGNRGEDFIIGNQGFDTIWGDLENITDIGDKDYIRGGDGDDEIHAGGGDDTVYGDSGYGDDRIWGDDGNDTLYGGVGLDYISGGNGNDYIEGNDGNDTIDGDAGKDEIYGNNGNDLIHGNDGNDTIQGNDGADEIYGDAGEDFIEGNIGDDIIFGGTENDTIEGNEGDDNITGDAGNDLINGNDGNDTIQGSEGDDRIFGDAGNDLIFGDDGADTITGDAGDDTISGGNGNDTINGNDGNDLIAGDAGQDIIHGDGGNDAISGGLDNDRIFGDNGNDLIQGDGGDDTIFGGNGDDILSGNDGNDQIAGDAGQDLIHGNLGDDLLTGGDGNDTVYGDEGNDTMQGNGGNDQLFGGTGDDLIQGDDGTDRLYGEDGDDTMAGNNGDDLMAGGNGQDTMNGGLGNDFINGQNGDDLIAGEAGDDTLYGENGDDKIYGGDGNDYMVGGYGGDLLDGGAGLDMISYYTSNEGVIVQLSSGHNKGGEAQGDNIANVENLEGSFYDDWLIGDNGNNLISALAGNDNIDGKAGNDILFGGDGNDYLDGNSDNDWIAGGNGNDQIYGGRSGDDILSGDAGDDYINGSSGNDILFGGTGNDTIDAGSHDDKVYGGAGNDIIDGGTGNDILFGEEGDDILYGHTGDNLLYGGLGNDKLYGSTGLEVDTFAIGPNTGLDTILNFQVGTDIIGLVDGLTGNSVRINYNFPTSAPSKGNKGGNSPQTSVQDIFIESMKGELLAILKDVSISRNQTIAMVAMTLPEIAPNPLGSTIAPPVPPSLAGSQIFPGEMPRMQPIPTVETILA